MHKQRSRWRRAFGGPRFFHQNALKSRTVFCTTRQRHDQIRISQLAPPPFPGFPPIMEPHSPAYRQSNIGCSDVFHPREKPPTGGLMGPSPCYTGRLSVAPAEMTWKPPQKGNYPTDDWGSSWFGGRVATLLARVYMYRRRGASSQSWTILPVSAAHACPPFTVILPLPGCCIGPPSLCPLLHYLTQK